jgi:adenylate cyclase
MSTRFGVRSRLLLSFIGISGFAVLAAAAALYSFLEIRNVINRITEQQVPITLATQQLSVRVESIVSETPTLLAASTSEDRSKIWIKLASDIKEIDKLISTLHHDEFSRDALAPIEGILTTLRSNLFSLNALSQQLIDLAAHKTALLDQMRKIHHDTLVVLGPWITSVGNDVQRLRTAHDDTTHSSAQQVATKGELIESLTTLSSLQKILQEVTEAQENLSGTAFTETSQDLATLKLRTQWSMEALRTLANSVDSQPKQLVLAEVQWIRRFFEGDDTIPLVREQELALLANSESLRLENLALSRKLVESVDLLVLNTRTDISHATSQAHTVITASSYTVVIIVFLSLASSILIVWFYVDRNLIVRLTALSNSMLAIAKGNLGTQLPPAGVDEIGRMAEALVVFRDTAIEVEATNLREIMEARRRLVNAIESISEGFSLYDPEDNLVICNSRYYEIFYPGMIEVMQPGTSFEVVIRGAAERNLIEEVHSYASVDAWVAERLERHRNPSGSYIQRRGDRQWIQISERRTEDGGYVAVYTDITEIKDREEELDKKSRALEQLSSQLAKYLSPQVYDSIFSGKQEVKVASSRKKLSVFFSDIAGFTGTAERLESEDLTQLLNHYLTEMSRIALDHGATIDKYVGDAIVIFFGDPESRGIKEDALACVRMAIAMRERMRDLEHIWRDLGIETPLKCRMGINTGFCTVGNFGSEDRMDYTIVGGGVNLASRLEGATTPGEILVSYETYALVKDEIECEGRGEIEVKGFSYPIATYQVVDAYARRDKALQRVREDRPNFKLSLDMMSMSDQERVETAAILRSALEQVTVVDAGNSE